VGICPDETGWSFFLPGLPIQGRGETFELARDALVASMRAYARAWTGPQNSLVDLIALSCDENLYDWLTQRLVSVAMKKSPLVAR